MKLQGIRLIPGTKISHDIQGDSITSFPYGQLVQANIPAIGIHARQNRLVIIDVDVPGATHKHDGRPWWVEFAKKNNIPATYAVRSLSGGLHFYYALPPHIPESSFHPPAKLALGVDIKYNGFVGAPPTYGYSVIYPKMDPGMTLEDAHKAIAILPPALLEEIERVKVEGKTSTFEGIEGGAPTLRRYFSEAQVAELKYKIRWIQENATLTRDEWRDGIFSLKAGLYHDNTLLHDMVTMWTCNRSFAQGDVELAMDMANKADPFGRVGPGTIFAIIEEVFVREGFVAPGATVQAQEILDKAGIIPETDKKGKLKIPPTEANAAAVLGAIHPPDEMYYDVRQDLYIYKGEPKSDTDIINALIPTIQKPLAGLGFEKLSRRLLSDGLDVIMHQRQVDPHKEYLKNLRWDGIPRIETCLIQYLGVEDNEYNRRLGVNLWAALAARGLSPGIKFDSVFVFEGYEGLKKSTFVEFIGGQYTYVPSVDDIFTNLDCLRQMHQSVIVELPELKGLVDVDSETAKAFIAKPYDHIRALWAKKAMKRLRGFILMGTTNNKTYLQKAMGIRRFWPIRVPRRPNGIDINGLRAVRDQLFAEGVQKFQNGHEYWFMPEELLEPVVRARQVNGTMKKYIAEVVGNMEGFSTLQIFGELAKAGAVHKKLTESVAESIEDCLRDLGFVSEKDAYREIWKKSEEKKIEPFLSLKDLI